MNCGLDPLGYTGSTEVRQLQPNLSPITDDILGGSVGLVFYLILEPYLTEPQEVII